MNTKQIAEEAAAEIVKARYSHENHFTVLVSNIIQAAVENAWQEGYVEGSNYQIGISRAAHASEERTE